MTDDDRPFTIESAAEYLECSPMHVRRLCKSGQLAYFRLGRLIRIPRSAIRELQEGARKQKDKEKVIRKTNPADWHTPRSVE